MTGTLSPGRGRIVPGLLAGGLAVGALAGCTISSENVSCSVESCTVTLSGAGAEAELLGTTLSFGGTEDGRAELSVGNTSVSCGEGEAVTAGPLSLECTSVTEDAVELTAALN